MSIALFVYIFVLKAIKLTAEFVLHLELGEMMSSV